jgi:hypothetical protein
MSRLTSALALVTVATCSMAGITSMSTRFSNHHMRARPSSNQLAAIINGELLECFRTRKVLRQVEVSANLPKLDKAQLVGDIRGLAKASYSVVPAGNATPPPGVVRVNVREFTERRQTTKVVLQLLWKPNSGYVVEITRERDKVTRKVLDRL